MKLFFLNFFLFASVLNLLSCKAPDGDIGPQGPAGMAGDKGSKGAIGDKGALSGVVSAWSEIKPAQWKLTDSKAVFTLTEARLTEAMLNQALILAYYRPMPEDESSAVISLADETNTYLFTFKANVGSLDYEVNFKKAEFVNPNLEDWNIKVRYVIVPPATAGRFSHVNWKDYNEVKRILNLKD